MKKYMFILLVLVLGLVACSDKESTVQEDASQMDSSVEGLTYSLEKNAWSPMMAQLLDEVDDPRVEGAYNMAVQYPDVLDYMPCYCGCYESNGHEHVRHCFVEDINEEVAVLDSMGFGCPICIEITEEAVAKYEEGESLPDIRAYIDQKYSENGVDPTPTPLPEG